MVPRRTSAWLLLLLSLAACDDEATPSDAGAVEDTADGGGDSQDAVDAPDQTLQAIPGTQVIMDFTRADGLYNAPFPDDSLLVDGRVDISAFPNPNEIALVTQIADLVAESADGFGLSSAIYFTLDGPPGDLPDMDQTMTADAQVFLISVDRDAPDFGQRVPLDAFFEEDGGPFGAANLLTLLPLQGMVLREGATYAAGVLRGLGDSEGEDLGVSLSLVQLAAGVRPEGMSETAFATYTDALTVLAEQSIAPSDLAALTVFTTGHPTAELDQVFEQVRGEETLAVNGDWELTATFDEYCRFENTVDMPVYQEGEPPFETTGGTWAFEGDAVVRQSYEEARLVVTVPRQTMPDGGFPTVVLIRAGGAGEIPITDRGAHPAIGEEAPAGSGPAREFALSGYAGVQVDGPHLGLRNITQGDDQILIFNFRNPGALRDNIRQSALEVALLADQLDGLGFAATGCEGFSTSAEGDDISFDGDHLVLMGHSTGATISPLVLAIQPAFSAVILSGAGGSYIDNLVYKESPLPVRLVAEGMLGYNSLGRDLTVFDPVASLLQWAGDSAEPVSYARRILLEPTGGVPRHVLMVEGIVDTYNLPPMQNAMALSIGMDLAGDELDRESPDLEDYRPMGDVLPWIDRGVISLPASGNRSQDGRDVTAVVVQHLEDGIDDGHEVIWQLEPPKAQYRCFLETLANNETPLVPAPDGSCP